MTPFALWAAAAAIAGCLVLKLTATAAVQRMRPGQAVVLLTCVSLTLSLACGAALAAIAVAVLATVSAVAAEGQWSAATLRTQISLPGWLGVAAAVAVLVLLARAAVRTVRIGSALFRADRLARDLRAHGGPVVVVDDDTADAYTVAGIRGAVVISRRLLDHLDADGRRVLTAHELSHLSRRHHLYVHLADIAAAANPLLRAVPTAVRTAIERWADEDAATGVGDRRLAGRALARVALLRSSLVVTGAAGGQPAGLTRLGIAGNQTAARVQALLQPARRRRTGQLVVSVGLSLVVLGVGLASLDHIQDAIESASR